MAELPPFLEDETEETIRNRMLSRIPDDIDKSEGSYIWDALAPVALEIAQLKDEIQAQLERVFMQTSHETYLDNRAEEHGVIRRPATRASGTLQFKGSAGVLIPKGTRVATPASSGGQSITFVTTEEGNIGLDGTGTVPAECEQAGTLGNVPSNSVSIVLTPLGGVSGVANPLAFSGGVDQEEDDVLRARGLAFVRQPGMSGNKPDYFNWAMEVPGVGGAVVEPIWDGNGTVRVTIVDLERKPPDQLLIDQVQTYIAPPWVDTVEAEAMIQSGYGVSEDVTQGDASGTSIKMVYNASGTGQVAQRLDLEPVLQQAGIWRALVMVKVDDTAETSNLLELGVYNLSAARWAYTTASGPDLAHRILRADELDTTFAPVSVEFYWNGEEQLEFRAIRRTEDQVTTLWVDQAVFRSAFSKDTGEGKAPVGAKVTVQGAEGVPVNIAATVTLDGTRTLDEVRTLFSQALDTYLSGLVFAEVHDVSYAQVGALLVSTSGVADYTNLTLNGQAASVVVDLTQVAVQGTVNLSGA